MLLHPVSCSLDLYKIPFFTISIFNWFQFVVEVYFNVGLCVYTAHGYFTQLLGIEREL